MWHMPGTSWEPSAPCSLQACGYNSAIDHGLWGWEVGWPSIGEGQAP